MYESPLFWPAHIKGKTLFVLDETLVPGKLKYIPVTSTAEAVTVIRTMKTRAFGQFLVVLNTFAVELMRLPAKPKVDIIAKIEAIAHALNNSRPTFPFGDVTAIIVGAAKQAAGHGQDVRQTVLKTVEGFQYGIRSRRLKRVADLSEALKSHDAVLTHCNVSGELAMACAQAVAAGKKIRVYATETRPYMQGAKLTVWELQQAKIPVTLVADNAVGSLMSQGLVNKVVIGSDRSAANGDIANKIGSYQIAVLAKEFGIPLIALTQPSKTIATGDKMPIEMRDEKEVLSFEGKVTFPKGTAALYPGFDVVPHTLITKAIAIHAGL